MMRDEPVWIKLVIGVLRGVSYIYDWVTVIPWYIFANPHRKRILDKRLKGKAVDENDPGSAHRSIDHFESLTTTLFPECSTLDDLFTRAVSLYGPRQCLGNRQLLSAEDEMQPNGKVFKKVILGKYVWLSFDEVYEQVCQLGSGLAALGQHQRQNICIYAETQYEWIIAAQACFKYNFPVVTLYSTLGEDAVIHGVNESEVSIVITSSDLLPKFKVMMAKIPRIKHLIYMPLEGSQRTNTTGFPSNVQVHSTSDIRRLGALPENIEKVPAKPKRSDIAMIMYTSGSQGMPKGVMMSHGNLMCGMSGQCQRIPNLGPNDAYISYLPLAHVLELTAELSCMAHGTRLGFSSPQTITDQSTKIKKGSKGDCSEMRPTLMAAVPVIIDRIYKNVWDKINEGGPFQKALFTFAYEWKRRRLSYGYDTPISNTFIFKKVRGILGGRIRLMLSGAAPLSADSQLFMNICFCCPVGQGYGLTETCGAGCIQETTDLSTSRVGAPLQCNELRLVNWEEGGYKVENKPYCQGEIWIGGGNVAVGYYKNEAKTKEDFIEADGQRWFSTGDIGEFHEDGCLKIIDRKKDLVKYSGGEYVSLGKVETALKLLPLVDNICVYADSSKDFAVCLVVPNPKHLRVLGAKLDLATDCVDDLCCHPAVVKGVLDIITEQATKAKLQRFETPKRVKLCTEVWATDNGFITDSFKLKRRNIEKYYAKEITRMYA